MVVSGFYGLRWFDHRDLTGSQCAAPDFGRHVAQPRSGADPAVKDVVIDMVAVSFTDIEGADMIKTVTEEMGRDGIQVHLAHVHKSVLTFLKEDGVDKVLGPENVHEDVFAAVEAIQAGKDSSLG